MRVMPSSQQRDHAMFTDGGCERGLGFILGRKPLERHVRKSAIVKRSIVIRGHKTSVSLEDAFWSGLHEIAAGERMSVNKLVEQIERGRTGVNLSSEIRVFVLNYFHGVPEALAFESIADREATHAEANR